MKSTRELEAVSRQPMAVPASRMADSRRGKVSAQGTTLMKIPVKRTQAARKASLCARCRTNCLKMKPVRRVAQQEPSARTVQMRLICWLGTPTAWARYGWVGPKIPMARP